MAEKLKVAVQNVAETSVWHFFPETSPSNSQMQNLPRSQLLKLNLLPTICPLDFTSYAIPPQLNNKLNKITATTQR